MDETIFNKMPKTEPFDIKPKIEPKEELGNKDVSNNIEDYPFENISDDSFSHPPNRKDVEVSQKVRKGLKRKRTSLHTAAETGDFSTFQMIFDQIKDKNPKCIRGQFTPLHIASKFGDFF